MSAALVNGDVSFWWNSIGRESPRPALPGSTQADVCIIGAGYTGLWAAYYLKKAAPQLLLQIVELISLVLVNKNVDTSGPVLID